MITLSLSNTLINQSLITWDVFKYKRFHNKPMLILGSQSDFTFLDNYAKNKWGKSYLFSINNVKVEVANNNYSVTQYKLSDYPFNYDILITENFYQISETNKAEFRSILEQRGWGSQPELTYLKNKLNEDIF